MGTELPKMVAPPLTCRSTQVVPITFSCLEHLACSHSHFTPGFYPARSKKNSFHPRKRVPACRQLSAQFSSYFVLSSFITIFFYIECSVCFFFFQSADRKNLVRQPIEASFTSRQNVYDCAYLWDPDDRRVIHFHDRSHGLGQGNNLR